ncbi:MAG: hypothetical protein Q8P67_17365, partial [archaeon]|nr:hypothetical protein [archaeon]
IADLLSKNKDEMARVKACALIYQDYMIEVLNMVELYAETIHTRAQILLLSPGCPEELKKEIASVIYAAPFIENDELLKVRMLFIKRFGKWFPEHCLQSNAIDPALVARLKRDQPDPALINYYLSTIAKRHNIDWALPSPDQLPPAAASVVSPTSALPSPASAPSGYGFPSQPQHPGGSSFPSFPATPGSAGFGQSTASSFAPVGGYGQPTQPTSGGYGQPSAGGYGQPSAGGYGLPSAGDSGGDSLSSLFPSAPSAGSSLSPSTPSSGSNEDNLLARLAALGMGGGAASTSPTALPSTGSFQAASFPLAGASLLPSTGMPLSFPGSAALQSSSSSSTYGMPAAGGKSGGDDLDALWSQTTALSSGSNSTTSSMSSHQFPSLGGDVGMGGGGRGGVSSGVQSQLLLPNSKVVLDSGSGSVKVGFSGENQPRAVVPTLVGTPLYSGTMPQGISLKDFYVGAEAQAKRGILTIGQPIRGGVVKDWDGLEKVWDHAFVNEMRVNPSSSPVCLTEPPLMPRGDREHMVQMLFERFQVPAVYMTSQPLMALHSLGLRSGIVLDCGHGVTHAVPVYDGVCFSHAIQRLDIGGLLLTDHLIRLLQQSGTTLVSSSEREIAQDIKERLAYVALDPAQEIQRSALHPADVQRTYSMPDGQIVSLSSQRFQCAEPLFNPSLLGKEALLNAQFQGGLSDLVFRCVVNIDIHARRSALANVQLAGGTSLLPGLQERLAKELAAMAPPGVVTNVVAPPSRIFSSWIGASMTAATQTTGWITREAYQEQGIVILHKLFPV